MWLAVRAAVALLLTVGSPAVGQVHLPRPTLIDPITVNADASSRWIEGPYEVRRLQGQVSISQGGVTARGDDAVVWTEYAPRLGEPTKVFVYLESANGRAVEIGWRASGAAAGDPPGAAEQSPTWYGRFWTTGAVDWRTPDPTPPPVAKPEIYRRGAVLFGPDAQPQPEALPPPTEGPFLPPPPPGGDPSVQAAQFQQFTPIAPPPEPSAPSIGGFRQVMINRRSEVDGSAEYRPQQGVGVLSGGVNLIVEGLQIEGVSGGAAELLGGPIDKIDIETDRAVLWTTPGTNIGSSFQQSNDTPLEIYMEGNIVFRQGDRTIYADRMYYDVTRRVGVILNAELLTPLPEIDGFQYQGLVRLKGAVIRQLDDARFVATDAVVTTSRLEDPSYSLRSDTIAIEDKPTAVVDPATGIVRYDHQRVARSRGNRIEFGGVPLLYWPTIVTDLEEPVFYISDLRVGSDSVFGTQILADFDVYQLLGMERLAGTDWDLSLDYLSDRGFGYGSDFEYARDRFWTINGPAVGRVDAWAISDSGLDNLGFGRRDLTPEETYRGRVFWNHRQRINDGLLEGWTAQAEVGLISDRTFLEQYYEAEWDENKDQTTGIRLKRINDNRSLSFEANGRINHFFTQTQWLPRLDHYLLGQDVFNSNATWFAHTHAGYANLKVASDPTNPDLLADFDLFPWETATSGGRVDGEGERVATRQEIDLPIDAAPFKVVPYALGEVAHWGADLGGEDLQRAYFQAGVRASLPMWAVNPAVRDPLFNLNGLAHKVVFDAELLFADANENYDDLPLYDAIDDDAIEEIRRNLFEPPFAVEFDPRFYAIRSGMQGYVAAPSTELVEDQMAVRLGMRHRLQTKRGAPGRQRIIDWMTLDANATFFPDASRDNFGEEVGLVDYDFVWHVGDRFALVSDGFADVFDDGLQTVSAGLRTNRPLRGNAYLGFRTIRGPFEADLITATVNYRLGPKWVTSASTVFDFGEAGNIGQSVAFSRIGEAIIVSVGANVDASKDNVGFNFLIEPRFLPRSNLTRRTGIVIPPPSLYYLE